MSPSRPHPTALDVRNPATGEVVEQVPWNTPEDLEAAIQAASTMVEPVAAMARSERREILKQCGERFRAEASSLASLVTAESGKPIRDSRAEVGRLVETFEFAAEEVGRMGGEVLPMDIAPRAVGYRAMTKRVPVGACGFITPFNFPLNLVAHKVAPAIAAGCPFVLKPADKTPLSALAIGRIVTEAGWPAEAGSILVLPVEDAAPIVRDERLRLFSFTGSESVGLALAKEAGAKRVVLELGGNACCVVDEGVDLDDAATRIVTGGMAQSGQSCVSVQRVLAHASVIDGLRDRLIERLETLRVGDPTDPETAVGPLIDEASACRVVSWIERATEAGARLLVGGTRAGSVVAPTLLEGAPVESEVVREEVFGPVLVLSVYDRFESVLEEINRSRFGLQAGVFTHDLRKAHLAWDRLHVGAVLINEVPAFRMDHTPYGGVKRSGLGREGVRSSMLEMTEERLLVVRDRPL